MDKCFFSRLLCLAVMFTAGVTVAARAGASDAAPPNILLIVSEDNGLELGCYGDPYAKTPRLDHLAAASIRFDRAFVRNPVVVNRELVFLIWTRTSRNGCS